MTDALLLSNFVASFDRFDEMVSFDPVPAELDPDGGADQSAYVPNRWRPAPIPTDPAALRDLYAKVPSRLPPLYEQLVLSYRWLNVEAGEITLLANPPATSLAPLAEQITWDPALVEVLFPLGLIPFARAGGGRYDPICFDTRARHDDGDCPIWRFWHEAILCDGRIGESWKVADSFRSLVETTVRKAQALPPMTPPL